MTLGTEALVCLAASSLAYPIAFAKNIIKHNAYAHIPIRLTYLHF